MVITGWGNTVERLGRTKLSRSRALVDPSNIAVKWLRQAFDLPWGHSLKPDQNR